MAGNFVQNHFKVRYRCFHSLLLHLQRILLDSGDYQALPSDEGEADEPEY